MAPKQHLVVGMASPEGRVLTLRLAAPHLVSAEPGHGQAPPSRQAATAASPQQEEQELLSPPDPRQLHLAIQKGEVAASDSKKLRTVRQLQSQLAYLQRQQGLPTGLCGGWNLSAQEKLDAWLLSDLKGSSSTTRSSSSMALEDNKPCSVGSDAAADRCPKRSTKKRKIVQHEGQASAAVDYSSSSSSSSSTSESTKARRGRLNKVMSCLNSLEVVLDPECEDCARVLSEAKAHLKACF